MTIINTNMPSIIATNAITMNERDQEVAMERLSTGLRINSAGDDAAGLAISSRMKAEVTGLEMATRNSNDAISMLETLEGSSREIAAILQRMRELAVQAGSDTMGVTDRFALDLEFGQLMNEIQRIATQTTWNEITIMNGGNDAGNTAAVATTRQVTATDLNIQLGKNSGQTMALTIKSFDPRTAVRAAARIEKVNPVTGTEIAATPPAAAAGGNPAVLRTRTNNLFTDATLTTVAGGDHRTRFANTALGADGAGFATMGLQTIAVNEGGLLYAGNDNHVMADPTDAGARNRRNAETQAFGSAVLFVGNNLNQNDETGGANGAAALADAPWSDTLQNKERIAITSRVNAAYALHNLDIAISAISSERAKYGAYIGRLEYAGDNLTNVARHQEQSRSRIADADYAVETTQLSRTTIIAQASTAMLAQANASKQSVLTLLQ
jgi:flagellin